MPRLLICPCHTLTFLVRVPAVYNVDGNVAANLPGSVAERQLLESFSRMLPELLRFSSASHLLAKIPEELQAHHRVKKESGLDQTPVPVMHGGNKTRQMFNAPPAADTSASGLWDGWEDAGPSNQEGMEMAENGDDSEEIDLSALGL